VFGHVPDAVTVLGMGVVAASGVLIAVRGRGVPAEEQAAAPAPVAR
jgi:hypothetical protein